MDWVENDGENNRPKDRKDEVFNEPTKKYCRNKEKEEKKTCLKSFKLHVR